jgi:hypothetical protein
MAAHGAKDFQVVEGNAGLTIVTVTLVTSSPANGNVTGQYQTADGTATVADNDYHAAAGDFFIPSGQTQSNPIQLEIVGDLKVEADETFTLQLFNVVNGAALDPGPYTFHIINDDAPAVAVPNTSVVEGNSGTNAMTFTVTLTSPAAVPVQATFATADGTATAGQDYQSTSGTLNFAVGEVVKTVTVIINGDTTFEADETLTLTVTPAGGAPVTATGTIVNDDVPSLTVADTSVLEGNSGTTAMVFVVTLTAAAGAPVQATYRTADGTATAGQDYQATSGTLTFAPGVRQQAVTVSVNGDTTFEPDETLTLTVTPAGGVPVTATGTIVNDDQPPLGRLTIISGNGQKGRLGLPLPQPLVVEVANSSGALASGVTVQWKVTAGDAQLTPPSSVTNAQGRASTTVTLNSVGVVEVEASVAQLPPVKFTLASETSFEARAQGPVAVPIAHVLDQVCARNETVFADACRALSKLSDEQLSPTLEHVAPQQSGAQSKVASEAVSFVTTGIGARLAALRSGVERFSIQHLSLDWNGRSVPVGAMTSAFLQATAPAAAGSEEKDYNGWSAFLSGNLGSGKRIGRFGQLGFDLKTRGLMLGVDRQFGDNVFGVSVNVMRLESTLNDSVGSLNTDGYALSIYGSRSGLFAGGAAPGAGAVKHYDGVHLDGSLTVGRNRYDAQHVVDIPTMPLSVARSKNNANVFALAGGTGVEAHHGRTDYDLSLSGTWSRAHVDDLTESGDGPLILFVQGHEIESAVATAAVNVRSAWPVWFGNVLPMVRGEMIHEFKSGARLVTARFLRDRLDTSFTVPLDRPDANYGKLAAGIQGVFPRGVSAYIEVTQDVLRSDLHFRTVQVNISKSF